MNMKESLLSLARHVLTFAGGFVVAKGWADEATVQAIVGALITIGGAAWGIIDKQNPRPSA